MHMGRTSGRDVAKPMLHLGAQAEGAVSSDGRVMGCYLHGLFASDPFRHAFLSRLKSRPRSGLVYEDAIEATLDRLAAHLARHLDLDRLLATARSGGSAAMAAPRKGAHIRRIG